METKSECCRGTRDCDSIQKESVILAHFPEQVATEILVWLPVKSLLRFRCVSKSFYTLIDSRYFINLHLKTSANNRPHHPNLVFLGTQLISTNYNSAKLHLSNFDKYSLEDKSLLKKRWARINYLEKKTPMLDIYGYCNGVFLVAVNSLRLALWNPSTQQRRDLPHCPIKRDPLLGKFGFGYDSTHDDYKVVLIASVGKFDIQQVWIFGLRSNSWRTVQTDFFLKRKDLFIPFGNFAHGELYWRSLQRMFKDSCIYKDSFTDDIVAFDLSKEKFSLITQPLYPTKGRLSGLYVLDGCLCISFRSDLAELVALYVRKKDGPDFKWSILYSVTSAQVPPFLKMDHFKGASVLGYSKEGDHKIMLKLGVNYKYMMAYDLKEKSFHKTTITCLPSNEYYLAIPCLESLVSCW